MSCWSYQIFDAHRVFSQCMSAICIDEAVEFRVWQSAQPDTRLPWLSLGPVGREESCHLLQWLNFFFQAKINFSPCYTCFLQWPLSVLTPNPSWLNAAENASVVSSPWSMTLNLLTTHKIMLSRCQTFKKDKHCAALNTDKCLANAAVDSKAVQSGSSQSIVCAVCLLLNSIIKLQNTLNPATRFLLNSDPSTKGF